MKYFLVILFLFSILFGKAQIYPLFGNEKAVAINGLTFDAMEPFISLDGNTLFFNSLNSGGNTNLYYATRVNDTTFNYVGMVGGTYDPSPNHLDAVASHDSLNNFFWTSLRNYPSPIENLHRGVYNSGNVSSITRVYGSMNIYSFNFPYGWLIMDAAINFQGDLLYYCNAKFDFSSTSCVGVPCESKMGVAQKINDSTFNKLNNSDGIFENINDTTNYIIYAPQVTKDGLELYFTRLLKNSYNTEICVSVRNSITDTFSLPMVIYDNFGFFPEAASPTSDKQKIYYHQKNNSGIYQIYVRYRNGTTGINENKKIDFNIAPNPMNDYFKIEWNQPNKDFNFRIYSLLGEKIMEGKNEIVINTVTWNPGLYFVIFELDGSYFTKKVIKR